MPKVPFVGPSYTYRSLNYDAQRSVNLFPVKSEMQDSKEISALVGRPGYSLFSTLPNNRSRGSRAVLGRAFVVYSNKLYEIFSDGSYVERGTLLTDTFFVSMSDNGQQVCIVDGPNGYIFALDTNVFTKITDPYFVGALTVTFIDGYFMFNTSKIYYISDLYNGLTGDPLDFASAEGSPDELVGLVTLHKEVWLFGKNTVEVVFDSGDANFPFQRISGAFIEYGCAAPNSIAKTANTVLWLGQDEYGSGVVWMAQGYQPQRVSTNAIEQLIQQFGDISDAIAYTYQEDGHYFYVLNFTNANTTIVYDIGLNAWHERADFSGVAYSRHRPQNHMFVLGKHLVGDFENGNLYMQSLSIFSDAGNTIRYMRTAPHLSQDLNYTVFSSFQIDMETGVGLSAGSSPETNPQVMLQWSDDGGHVYGNEHWQSFGKIGQYRQRVIWKRLGRSRDRVFRAIITSKSKVFIIGAKAE